MGEKSSHNAAANSSVRRSSFPPLSAGTGEPILRSGRGDSSRWGFFTAVCLYIALYIMGRASVLGDAAAFFGHPSLDVEALSLTIRPLQNRSCRVETVNQANS